MTNQIRDFIILLLAALALAACTVFDPGARRSAQDIDAPTETAQACPVTEPVWAKPPEDPAVSGEPAFGYYHVNPDRSMWASAWWHGGEEPYLVSGGEGVKIGWFRPEGADLVISGRRIDGESPPLEAHVPCCYPTRFQATGLTFPTGGCWEIHAQAGGSELNFIVWVEP